MTDLDARDTRIGPTAHYTAYTWHRLGFPYAELFATPKGRALFWSFRLAGEWIAAALPVVPSMTQYLEMRHRAIELALDDIGPDRIVEIGAGLSRRGVTWAADRGVRYLEVDLPHMVDAKREVIARRAPVGLRAKLDGMLRHEAKNVLADDFGEWLAERLSGAARPVVIAEGLVGYFDRAEQERLAAGIAAGLRAAGGGSFLCDLRSGEGGRAVAAGASVLRGAILIATRGRGVRKDFEGQDDVRNWFATAGFSRAEPVEVGRSHPHLSRVRSPALVWRAES